MKVSDFDNIDRFDIVAIKGGNVVVIRNLYRVYRDSKQKYMSKSGIMMEIQRVIHNVNEGVWTVENIKTK